MRVALLARHPDGHGDDLKLVAGGEVSGVSPFIFPFIRGWLTCCCCCCCVVPVDDSALMDLMDGGEMMMDDDDEEDQ